MKKFLSALTGILLIFGIFVLPVCADENVMLMTESEWTAAGFTNISDFQKSMVGKYSYQTIDHIWGRQGYSSIYGMASLGDGSRSFTDVGYLDYKSKNYMYWKIKNPEIRYDADAIETDGLTDDGYLSLIGYVFHQPVEITNFALYFEGNNDYAIMDGFDLLCGVENEKGDLEWKKVYSGRKLLSDKVALPYEDNVVYVDGVFDAPVTCTGVQIAVTDIIENSNNTGILVMTELELFGQYLEVQTTEAPATTKAPATEPLPVLTTAVPITTGADITEAPVTQAPADIATDAPVTAEAPAAQKSGCGSFVCIAPVIALSAAGIMLIKKKRK